MVRQITDRNGRIPAAELTRVGTDHYERPALFLTPAAESWQRMVAAGLPWLRDGRDSASDTYRDLARQWDYYRNPPNGAGLAAYPGTSWHGEGLAVDARGSALTWLADHGAEYGWVRTIPAESWHFEYDADRDEHQEDEMPLSQEDLEKVREASANGALLLFVEAAAGSTPRGRQARDAIRAIVATAPGVNLDALTKRVLDGFAKRLSQ